MLQWTNYLIIRNHPKATILVFAHRSKSSGAGPSPIHCIEIFDSAKKRLLQKLFLNWAEQLRHWNMSSPPQKMSGLVWTNQKAITADPLLFPPPFEQNFRKNKPPSEVYFFTHSPIVQSMVSLVRDFQQRVRSFESSGTILFLQLISRV